MRWAIKQLIFLLLRSTVFDERANQYAGKVTLESGLQMMNSKGKSHAPGTQEVRISGYGLANP